MKAQVQQNSSQFVIFFVNEEEYGIDIDKITTIEKLSNLTRIPKAHEAIKGVINLRGEIIPVVDLAKKLKMEPSEYTEDTRIIIFKIDEIEVGFIVDEVVEVLSIQEDQIDDINQVSTDISLDYIRGIGKVKDKIITLLNLDKLIIFK